MQFTIKRTMGALFWIALLGCVVTGLTLKPIPWANSLAAHFSRPHVSLLLTLPHAQVRPRTPIYMRSADQQWQLVGHLLGHRSPEPDSREYLAKWYGPVASGQCNLTYYEASNSLTTVVRTLMSSEKQAWVKDRLERLFREHRQEMLRAVQPIFERSMRESLPVIEDEFKASVVRHRNDLDRIAERYKTEVVKQRLVPMMKEEVFPIVRLHAEPLAREIGRELWDRASVWRFGWRYLYDKSPLPDRRMVKEEWERFVKEEAIPLLNSRTEEMLEVQRKIFSDMVANPRIREQLDEVGDLILHDEELRNFVQELLRETVVENQALREVWLRNWQTPEAKAALELIGERVEPVVREIGDAVFGTKEAGISPEFARVLRNQILGKDRRWLVAEVAASPITTSVRIVPLGDANAAEVPLLLLNSTE